jgi:hypothetical protein
MTLIYTSFEVAFVLIRARTHSATAAGAYIKPVHLPAGYYSSFVALHVGAKMVEVYLPGTLLKAVYDVRTT